jgi:hypothetical protein
MSFLGQKRGRDLGGEILLEPSACHELLSWLPGARTCSLLFSSNRLIHWLALCPWTEDRIRSSPSFFIVVRWPRLLSGTLHALRRPPLICHTHTHLTFSLGARSRKYIQLRRRAREWAIAAIRVDSNMFIIRPGE